MIDNDTENSHASDHRLDDVLKRVLEQAEARRKNFEEFIATQSAVILCSKHPHVERHISLELSRKASDREGAPTARYTPCPVCAALLNEQVIQKRLHNQGVPEAWSYCSLENWESGPGEENHLKTIRAFDRVGRGFLLLLGNTGTGKTHLSVGLMRLRHNSWFKKQEDLLYMLRTTYDDSRAPDPAKRAMNAGLFVLDEIGMALKGKDEFPLLSRILDFRIGQKKPTVLTSNLDWPQLSEFLGLRLSDRLKQATFRILTFNGSSRRAQSRSKYFDEP